MALPVDELLLRTERDALLAISRAAPRSRPEVQRRLQLVTARLLSLELTRPLQGVPEYPETEGHRLSWYQKMKRTTKLRLPDARVATIAQRYFPEHLAMLVEGYRLAASSGLWQSGPGVLTLRLVYRRRSEGCEATHTYTFRGVVA